MGKKSAPGPDPRIGIAAMKSAELGEDFLEHMKSQAEISNRWARQDRKRYQEVFQPLQDKFISDAQEYDTPERQATAARTAVADVASQAALAQDAERRQLARMGVDPRSGRSRAATRSTTLRTGLAKAGAANTARRQIQAEGRAMEAQAVNLGSGLAVNPATSLGLSNGASSAGFQGAMGGYGQQGQMLLNQHKQQLSAHNSTMGAWGDLGSAMGTIGTLAIMSSKEVKEAKKPVRRSLLKEVREMPVEDWKYKDGVADGGHHTGPYAEDFQKATGRGDGRTINVTDALGVTMGALQELDRKVEALARRSLPKRSAGVAA